MQQNLSLSSFEFGFADSHIQHSSERERRKKGTKKEKEKKKKKNEKGESALLKCTERIFPFKDKREMGESANKQNELGGETRSPWHGSKQVRLTDLFFESVFNSSNIPRC